MKILAILVICFGLQIFTCDLSRAKGAGKGPIPDGGGSEPINLSSAEKNPDTIRGTCILVEDPKTSFSSPCVDIVVILNDEKGKELARTRTSSKGGFKFAADKTKSYILTASKAYDLVSPNSSIHGGDTVQLQLQQK